jgi:adenosine kinase
VARRYIKFFVDKPIIVTGSLAFDNIMSMPGRFSDHIMPDKLHILNVSFIMKTFRQEFGGTAGNIAYSLALLHTPSVLLAGVGNDFTEYDRHISKYPLIKKAYKVFKNEKTAQGFAITDRDDNQIWGFYDGAMRYSSRLKLAPYFIKNVLIMMAPNNPVAMEKYVDQAISAKCEFVYDPAFNIPHFSLNSLKKAVFNSTILIGNDYEITLIKRRLKLSSLDFLKKCRIVITTKGSKGSSIQTTVRTINIPAANPKSEADPTGAGDAYRSGFLAGFVRNFPLEVCGKMGAVASVYTVEKYGTQTHSFTPNQFKKRYVDNFGFNDNVMSMV